MKIDCKNALNFVNPDDLHKHTDRIETIYNQLLSKQGKGSDFLGWIDLPDQINTNLIENIINDAQKDTRALVNLISITHHAVRIITAIF